VTARDPASGAGTPAPIRLVLTDDGVHAYWISYPSGSRFQRRGVLEIISVGVVIHPTIRDGATVAVLDSRAVITRDGLVLYEPRRWAGQLRTFDDWLAEHPEWPRLATELLR
jgi:hypothetical protein